MPHFNSQNAGYGKPSRFWTYKRESWTPRHRWLPYKGGDEWCRYTLVLPIPFGGYLVTALWTCRNRSCDSCLPGCFD